jgi:ribosomal protein L11 methyltransferase
MARPALRRPPLWQLAVTTTGEAEDAVADLMRQLLGQAPSVFVAAETQTHVLSVFLEDPGAFTAHEARELRRGLARIRHCGLATGPGRIRFRRVRSEDWAEAWKRHFRPIEIGGALLLRPSWSRRRPRKDQVVVTLDPGLSFGTGQHPTTAFCLRQLVACRQAGKAQSFLDVGTGSGILAISACKLGYRPVVAIDLDPEAIHVAQANAEANGVSRWVRFIHQGLERLPGQGRRFDVICANLTEDLLLAQRHRLVVRLRTEGTLVLAGILADQFPGVRGHYEEVGLLPVASRTVAEWRSGAFFRPPDRTGRG